MEAQQLKEKLFQLLEILLELSFWADRTPSRRRSTPPASRCSGCCVLRRIYLWMKMSVFEQRRTIHCPDVLCEPGEGSKACASQFHCLSWTEDEFIPSTVLLILLHVPLESLPSFLSLHSFIFLSLSLFCVLWRGRSSGPERRGLGSDVIMCIRHKQRHGNWLTQLRPLNQSEAEVAMDCTATILKPCVCSRNKWCRHERSSSRRRSWRLLHGCGLEMDDVVSHTSSLLRRLLIYVCCCLSHEDSPELCRDWVAHPVNGGEGGGRAKREEEGESEGFTPSLFVAMFLEVWPAYVFMKLWGTSQTQNHVNNQCYLLLVKQITHTHPLMATVSNLQTSFYICNTYFLLKI